MDLVPPSFALFLASSALSRFKSIGLKKIPEWINQTGIYIGMNGFEPSTPCPPDMYATPALHPDYYNLNYSIIVVLFSIKISKIF